jgi:hypothetical protein
VKCTKTENFIGKGAHFDRLNNRSLVALFQALSETAGNLPRCIIKFHANGFERCLFWKLAEILNRNFRVVLKIQFSLQKSIYQENRQWFNLTIKRENARIAIYL